MNTRRFDPAAEEAADPPEWVSSERAQELLDFPPLAHCGDCAGLLDCSHGCDFTHHVPEVVPLARTVLGLRETLQRLRQERTQDGEALALLRQSAATLTTQRNHYRERAETLGARLDGLQALGAAAMRQGLAECRRLRGLLAQALAPSAPCPPKDDRSPRERATEAATEAETAMYATRRALREAVKDEVRALPWLGVATSRDDAHRRLTALLGPAAAGAEGSASARWDLPTGGACVWLTERGEVLEVGVTIGRGCAGWPLTGPDGLTFDAAMKAGLLWLADLDVFVTVRS